MQCPWSYSYGINNCSPLNGPIQLHSSCADPWLFIGENSLFEYNLISQHKVNPTLLVPFSVTPVFFRHYSVTIAQKPTFLCMKGKNITEHVHSNWFSKSWKCQRVSVSQTVKVGLFIKIALFIGDVSPSSLLSVRQSFISGWQLT